MSVNKGSSINDVTQFWTVFDPPIFTLFITKVLVLPSQNHWPLRPWRHSLSKKSGFRIVHFDIDCEIGQFCFDQNKNNFETEENLVLWWNWQIKRLKLLKRGEKLFSPWRWIFQYWLHLVKGGWEKCGEQSFFFSGNWRRLNRFTKSLWTIFSRSFAQIVFFVLTAHIHLNKIDISRLIK